MLLLFETSAGFALFKVLDEAKLKKTDISTSLSSVDSVQKIVALKKFARFKDTSEALKSTTALLESKLSKTLKNFLTKQIINKELKDKLAVADAKLGGLIKEELGIKCLHDSSIAELMRGIRTHINTLITSISDADLNAMSLGLAHSLSRYKLKFSPDKVDTMIVQAIALLDDLEKELNTYSMRIKEWYGWHFPELVKVISENLLYAKVVKLMGDRSNALSTDFSELLPEETIDELKAAAQVSMGTEVSEDDISNIRDLCDQAIGITEYKDQLLEYLKNRMAAIAPNLTVLLGDLLGARLIAHAGSLLNLAKYPASTVQILGAEKALFRALKTKHQTPKYGLIYQASLIGQAGTKNKGKIARVLAAKSSLACRFDALGEGEVQNSSLGIEGRTKVEQRLRSLESGNTHRLSGNHKPKMQTKYEPVKENITSYSAITDSTVDMEVEKPNGTKEEKKKKASKEKSPKKKREEEEEEEEAEVPEKRKKKKKSRAVAEEEEEAEVEEPEKRKKKKKKKAKEVKPEESESEEEEEEEEEVPEKRKKKKKAKEVIPEESESEEEEEEEVPEKRKKKKKSKDEEKKKRKQKDEQQTKKRKQKGEESPKKKKKKL